jgi:hypothetical protein
MTTNCQLEEIFHRSLKFVIEIEYSTNLIKIDSKTIEAIF